MLLRGIPGSPSFATAWAACRRVRPRHCHPRLVTRCREKLYAAPHHSKQENQSAGRTRQVMHHVRIAFVLACISLFATSAQAQTYPAKPVTIVVTLAAGGAAGVMAGAIEQRVTEEWGQPVVVENKGGANNQVGTASVARAAADGYTLLLTPEHTFAVNPFLYRRLSYDAVKDFTPLTGVVTISQALAVHPSLPAKTTAELVALAKGKPGELNYGGLGAGS